MTGLHSVQTDLDFVKMIAQRNGANFWVRCDTSGNTSAHFKRPDTAQEPSYALTINQDKPNIDGFQLEWESEAPTVVETRGVDPVSKSEINGDVQESPLPLLGSQGLSSIAAAPSTTHIAPAADMTGNLRSRAESAAIDANWFIQAKCTTCATVLGGIVRPHMVVTVGGLGSRHSGKYYVAAVRHEIDSTQHKMELTLLRNAWG